MALQFLLASLLLSLTFAFCPPPSTHSFSLGKINVTIISDGPIVFDTNVFSAPLSKVIRSRRRDFLSGLPIRISQNIALLDTPSGRYLVDSGSVGMENLFNFTREAGRLLENFAALGVTTDSIDGFLITHGHLDHAGGITRQNERIYKNAKVYIGKREHDTWAQIAKEDPQEFTSNFYLQSVAPYQKDGDLHLVGDFESPLPFVRFVPANGHSPGHNIIEIQSEGQKLVIPGDTWGTRSDTLRFPDWTFIADFNTTQTVQTRKKVLKRLAEERQLILSFHERFPGLGFVRGRGNGYEWIARDPDLAFGVGLVCSK